jgi:hypothetical protein
MQLVNVALKLVPIGHMALCASLTACLVMGNEFGAHAE